MFFSGRCPKQVCVSTIAWMEKVVSLKIIEEFSDLNKMGDIFSAGCTIFFQVYRWRLKKSGHFMSKRL